MGTNVRSMIIGFMPVIVLFCTLTASAQFSRGRLQAIGLTCALCSKSIHQALNKLSFIRSVEPELQSSSFELRFKSDSSVSVSALRAAVEDAGFFIGGLTLELTQYLSDRDQHAWGFSWDGKRYQMLEEPRQGKLFQVIGKGFLPEKEYKRMSVRYAKELKAAGATILLLPVKN